MKRIVITGASGMVGTALLDRLTETGNAVTAVSRHQGNFPPGVRHVKIRQIDATTDWAVVLRNQDVLIHLAALLPHSTHSLDDYERVNAAGTAHIVDQAAACGVRTVVFLSSIAVVTASANTVTVSDETPPMPANAYGRSKLAGENAVAQFASADRTGISLRPPLIYCANAKGNWQSMLKLAAFGPLLPFGAVNNRRTMVSIDNLASAILRVVELAEPGSSGAYAVADHESVSLAEMMRYLREGMGRRRSLLSVPVSFLAAPLRLAGKGQIADSLLGNLEIDFSRFRETFDWLPIESAPDAIRRSSREFAAIRQ